MPKWELKKKKVGDSVFFIVKHSYNDESQSYYTGLDDPELLYSNDFSDAKTFENAEACFLTYETLRAKLDQESNSNYYIFIDSDGGKK